MYAAHWGGKAPTATGHTPAPSTRQGTSTQASEARLAISDPRLITLPMIRAGSPVSSEWMMTAAYSPLCSIGNGSPVSRRRLVSAYSSRWLATRDRYSPIGIWRRSTASSLGMNHGLYSAWCSDDSVG